MGLAANIYNNLPYVGKVAALNLYAGFLTLERYGDKFAKRFKEFEANEKLSLGELREYQRVKLLELLKYAYENVPYYHELFQNNKLSVSDFKDLSDIQKLPLLTRDDVKKNYEKLKARNFPFYMIRHGHTSGTTGSPLEFLWDINVCVVHHVADWRQKRWAGFEFGDKFASLQGRQVVPQAQLKPPFWTMNYVHNQLFLSSFHLRDDCIPYYLEKLKQFSPRGLEGYPSSIYILAQYLEKTDQYLPLPAVLTSSETLQPLQRDVIERRFCCKVFDFYGMSERVVYGSECEAHVGRHLNLDYGYTEIVDSQENVMPDGSFGTVVSTGLWNYAMPLIRYKTSDASSIQTEKCPCGRAFPLMDPVTTKAEDIVVLGDGRMVPSSILTHPFKPLLSIKKSQIIQEDYGKFLVKLVVTPTFSKKDEELLLLGLKERLGNVFIKLEFVNDIEKTKGGKFRWVISKIK